LDDDSEVSDVPVTVAASPLQLTHQTGEVRQRMTLWRFVECGHRRVSLCTGTAAFLPCRLQHNTSSTSVLTNSSTITNTVGLTSQQY